MLLAFAYKVKPDKWDGNNPTACRPLHGITVRPGDICLRSDVMRCRGIHKARASGRVVAVERGGQPVETALKLRPVGDADAPATLLRCAKSSSAEANELARSLGLRPGDTFTVSRGATEPTKGRIIILVRKKPPHDWTAARFVRFNRSGGMVLRWYDGEQYVLDLDNLTPYHFDDSTITRAPHPHAARIAKLRDRLKRIGKTDDWYDAYCSERYQLETRIDDLLRGDGGQSADEWADFDLVSVPPVLREGGGRD